MSKRGGVLAAAFVLLGLLAGCDGCSDRPDEAASTKAEPPGPSPSVLPGVPSPAGWPQAATADASTKPAARRLPASELTWHFAETPHGPLDVVVHLPPRAESDRFPLLLAFHGRGEALKGPKRGARGWIDDYWLPRAEQRLFGPPLTPKDLINLVPDERLTEMNRVLAARAYRGLVVACPYTPDILGAPKSLEGAASYGRWLVEVLVPRLQREAPVIASASATGIDGVSLGGRLSVLVGLAHPNTFGVVGGLQPAFDSAEAEPLARRAEAARKVRPMTLRLLTSEGDFFLRSTRAIGRALAERGVPHRVDVVPGPHDYDFNRGPGAFEMLLFHDRALRGERYEL